VFAVAAIAAENEMNVHHALTTYPCLQLVPAEPRVGGSGLKGPADAVGFAAVLTAAASSCADQPHPAVLLACQEAAAALSKGAGHAWWLTEEQANMVQRFHPGGQHDTSGFFAAKFKKVGSVQDL
jgi:16S rRNA C967 or C1407 C5-methylase (RsmB/RsmF family)